MKMLLKVFLLLTVISAITCGSICPPDICKNMKCEDLSYCTAENGRKVREKGSFCNCCDICVKILGEGDRCLPEDSDFNLIIQSECGEGLYCDVDLERCVKPRF